MKKAIKAIYAAAFMCIIALTLLACSGTEINLIEEKGQVGSFSLASPENETGEIDIKPAFNWSKSENAKTYTLQIATDQDFEDVIFTRASLAQNEFKMSSNLYNNTQYFWKVTAYGAGDENVINSAIRSFTTKQQAASQEEQVLDDFESYEYAVLLQSEYYAPSGDAGRIDIIENNGESDFAFSDFFGTGRLLEVEYDLHTHKFSNYTRNLHRSLLGTDGISFKVGNMGASIKIVLDIFEKNGEGFRASVPVRGIMPYEIKIPYSEFQRHIDAGIPQDGELQIEDIAKFTIAIATDAHTSKGKAYIDDLKAYVDKSITQIVNTGYIASPMEANSSIIDLDSSDIDELREKMGYHPDGGVSTFEIVDGETASKQLKWVYDYDSPANKYWSMIRHYGYWNMSENHGISFRVKGNKSNNRIVIQLQDADGEFFYLKMLLDFDYEKEIVIPFSTLVLKAVDDGGVEVDGILHSQIINEISFTMESNVYDSSAKGGTIYLSDIRVFNDQNVKGLTIDGIDIQTVDLQLDFEKDKEGAPFDMQSISFTNANVEVAEDSSLFGENLLKVVTESVISTIDFERTALLKNAAGIAFWARSSHPNITLGFVLKADDNKDYIQTVTLNEGLNLLVLKMSNFKNSGVSLAYTSAEILNYSIVINSSTGLAVEVLLDNFYAYNTYNSIPLGRTVLDMIGKEMSSLPAVSEIDESNYKSIKKRTTTITNLILQNASNTEIMFSLLSLAPYIEDFFAVLNRIDDIEIGQVFEFGSMFKTNMVVQQGQDFAVHGFGKANEAVTVEFDGQEINTIADGNGRFDVVFPASLMIGSKTAKLLKATGESGAIAEIYAVLIGDVYMVMGQHGLFSDVPTSLTVEKNANVRIYTADSVLSGSPQQSTLNSGWYRTNTASFTYGNSILSYIGNEIYKQNTDIPIGIITVAYGANTPFEAYVSAQAFSEMFVDMKEGYHSHSIYNTYINPLLGAKLNGVIMLHGGGAITDADRYVNIMKNMQQDMQSKFATEVLPFYVVQSAIFSRFTQFSYNAAQSQLFGENGFYLVPATDVEQLNADGISKIVTRLVSTIESDVSYPYVTNIELINNEYKITFSEPVTYVGSSLDGFWLGNAEGDYDQNAIAIIDNNVVTVSCSIQDFEFNNVFYNINGRGNLVSVADIELPVGSFGTFSLYTIKSYNYIDEMKYESKTDFDKNWDLRIAGVAQANTSDVVTLVDGENKINFIYSSKGMQILTTPVNSDRASRDITDLRIWIKTTKNINFQCYLWFGSYPTDSKRYNTSLNVYSPNGGYIYIPLVNVWGSIENMLDSLTHIGIGLDAWDTGTIQIGEISFVKAELPSRFNLVKPAFGGVVAPNESIEFLWEVSKRAQSYQLEIKDSNNNIIYTVNTNNFYYEYTQGLGQGSYKYTVTAINASGDWQTDQCEFLVSEIVKQDTLYYDFEMTDQEFKETFKYRNSAVSPYWFDYDETAPTYASIEEVTREDNQTGKALKIDTTLAPQGQEDYYLAVRGAINGNEAFGARYLKFWYKSSVELSSLNENARVEINLYSGSNHYYARLYDIPQGEGYLYVRIGEFNKGSSSNPDLAISMVDSISIGVNVSSGATLYFDDISLTYDKD